MNFIYKDKVIDIDSFLEQEKEFNEYLKINEITKFSDGAILSQNEKIKLFELTLNRANEESLYVVAKIEELGDLLNIKVVYESLYEETFEEVKNQ